MENHSTDSQEPLRLSAEDQLRIAEAILDPPPPTPALQKAFQRRMELFGLAERSFDAP